MVCFSEGKNVKDLATETKNKILTALKIIMSHAVCIRE